MRSKEENSSKNKNPLPDPLFVIDAMHGKLAKLLRILGYDTIYANSMSDQQVLEICQSGGRVLVTGDRSLYERASKNCPKAIFIPQSTRVEKSLAILAENLGISLDIDMGRSRCPYCNARLEKMPRTPLPWTQEVYKCPSCGNYYWKGSHWKSLLKTLGEAKKWLPPR